MPRWLTSLRVAPIVAGLAGLAWFWAELAPQRAGFEDTDNPALGLAFISAHPTAWPLAGLALGIGAIALVPTMLGLRARLDASPGRRPRTDDTSRVAVDTVTTVGLFGAAMLFGMATVRMSGGPVRYVHGLDEGWGETAYLVTQFVGIQALLTGGSVLVALWLVGAAWLGARRRIVPRAVAALAVVPAARLLALAGPFGIEVEGAWLLLFLSIPAFFVWLVVLGLAVRTPGAMTTDDRLAGSPATDGGGGGNLGEASA